MRKEIGSAIAVSLLIAGASAFSVASANSAIQKADNGIAIGVSGTLTNYQEAIPFIPSDIESGWQPGIHLGVNGLHNLSGLSHVYTHIGYDYSGGSIAYMGSYQNGTPVDTTDNAMFQRVMARIGKGFNVRTFGRDSLLTPYLAGGFQDWNRSLQGPGGYTENYSAKLIGGGVMFQTACTHRLVSTANVEVLAIMGGSMTPSGLPVDYGTASFNTSGEEKISVGARYRIAGPWQLFAGMSLEHYSYTGGALLYGAHEPPSETNQFSVDSGIEYSFG